MTESAELFIGGSLDGQRVVVPSGAAQWIHTVLSPMPTIGIPIRDPIPASVSYTRELYTRRIFSSRDGPGEPTRRVHFFALESMSDHESFLAFWYNYRPADDEVPNALRFARGVIVDLSVFTRSGPTTLIGLVIQRIDDALKKLERQQPSDHPSETHRNPSW